MIDYTQSIEYRAALTDENSGGLVFDAVDLTPRMRRVMNLPSLRELPFNFGYLWFRSSHCHAWPSGSVWLVGFRQYGIEIRTTATISNEDNRRIILSGVQRYYFDELDLIEVTVQLVRKQVDQLEQQLEVSDLSNSQDIISEIIKDS